MFCPKCGVQIADAATFCPKCGARLKERTQGAAQPAAGAARPQASAASDAAPAHATPTAAVGHVGTQVAHGIQPIGIVAVVCALLTVLTSFLPWVSSSSTTQSLSSLASSLGLGASFQSSYTLAQMNELSADYHSYEKAAKDLSDLSDGVAHLNLDLSAGNAGGLSTDLSTASGLFAFVFYLWIVALIVLAIGVVLYLAKGRKPLMIVGLSLFVLLPIVVFGILSGTSDLAASGMGEILCLVAAIAGIGTTVVAKRA